MKAIIKVLFFFFCCQFSFAQELDITSDKYNEIENLYHIGQLYYKISSYEIATKKTENAYNLYKSTYKVKTNLLAEINLLLGLLYANDYKTNRAIALFEEALDIFYKGKQVNNSDLISTLGILGGLYSTTGQYEKAYTTLQKSLSIVEIEIGKNSEIYLSSLNQLINVCFKLNKEDLLLKYIKESKQLSKNIHGEKSIKNIKNLEELTQNSINVNNFTLTENLSMQTLTLQEEIYGKENIKNTHTLTVLGAINEQIGNYDVALQYYNRALLIQKKEVGENHKDYANSLAIIGELNGKIGNYETALSILKESISILKNNKIENAQSYMNLNVYANILEKTGNYKEALKVYESSLEKIEDKGGAYDYTKISILGNMANIFSNNYEFEKALSAFEKSLNIAYNNEGYNENQIFDLLISLSNIYSFLGNFDKSLAYSNLAKEKLLLFDDKNSTLTYQSNLGTIYLMKGDFKKAEKIFKEIKKKIDKKVNQNLLIVNQRLRNAYFGLKKHKQTFVISQEINNNILVEIEKNFMFMSDVEKKNYIDNIIQPNINLLSLLLNSKEFSSNKTKRSTSILLNNTLLIKGLLLNSSKNILEHLKSLQNKNIDKKINEYQNKKTFVIRQLQLPVEKRSKNIVKEKDLLQELEKELVKLHSNNFSETIDYVKDWKKNKLKENEISVEFSHYKVFNKTYDDFKIFYVAYLYKKDWKTPKVVNLFEEKQLKKYFSSSSNPNTLYASRGGIATSTKATLAVADSIYNLVWKPLEKYVASSSTIYFSPDGLLHKIPFAALPNKENKLIGEMYNIQQMGNTADIRTNEKLPNLNDVLLIGGVKYEYVIDNTKQKTNTTYSILESEQLLGNGKNRSLSRNGFTYLEGTEKEVKDIKAILNTSKQLSGYNATETAFKKLSGKSPSVLHIATHGFFFKKPKEKPKKNAINEQSNSYKDSDDPLLRSGLLFANANYAWQNGNNPYEEDDGILTALEISNLDLKNTDIVILSACETGLGDIEGSEGVYGLQRAFKMAGVKTIIMSLWPVPDAETAEFMNLFYTKWKAYNNPKKAFKETQQQMMNTYRETPEKWAAFVYFE
jgi:CHAT domain-containing protein